MSLSTRTAPPRRASRLAGALAATATATAALLAGPASVPAEAAPTAAEKPKAPRTHLIAVGSNPIDVAISQQLGKAFVVDDGGVTEISLLTQRRLSDFTTEGFHGQSGIALMRGETQAYVTNSESTKVVVFDTETHKILRRVDVGADSSDVTKANTPKGQRAYVALPRANRLVSIQTSTGKIAQRIKLPHPAGTVATEPGGKQVWAGSDEASRIYRVNTTSSKIHTIKTGPAGPPVSIAFTPNGKKAWVAGRGGVAVIDTRTGKTKKFLPIEKIFDRPVLMGFVALNGSGRYAYVENTTFPDSPPTERGSVVMIDTKTYRVLHEIPVGASPETLAIDTERDVAYVPNYNDDTVTYFDVPR